MLVDIGSLVRQKQLTEYLKHTIGALQIASLILKNIPMGVLEGGTVAVCDWVEGGRLEGSCVVLPAQ